MIRILLVLGGMACGVALVSLAPGPIDGMRARVAALPGMAWIKATANEIGTRPPAEHGHHEAGAIELSDEQIAAAAIDIGPAQAGVLSRRRLAPGTLMPAGDRIGRVAVRLLGTVAELRKRLSDPVERNEVVAVIESREVADAKSEYLATRVTHEL